MKQLTTGIGMLLGGCLVFATPQEPTTPNEQPAVVVGTFDSRAILFAHFGTDDYQAYLTAQKKDLTEALRRARKANDTQLAAQLDLLGPAMQRRIHEQGFGTAPVDDIIERIADKLPAIAKKAGVDVIVSKWTLTYQDPTSEFVDVTDLLVAEFAPNEATLKTIREIRAQQPVPLDQLTNHK